jgi:hypothetical protein
MVHAEEVQNQKKGATAISYSLGPKKSNTPMVDRESSWKISGLIQAMPLRMEAIHFCYDDPFLLPVHTLSSLSFNMFSRLRMRAQEANKKRTTTID